MQVVKGSNSEIPSGGFRRAIHVIKKPFESLVKIIAEGGSPAAIGDEDRHPLGCPRMCVFMEKES